MQGCSLYFDGEETPRLDLSVPELFGAKGSKYPFVPPLSVTFESGAAGNPGEGPANLCYVPIPFKKHIKITGRNIAFYHVDYHKVPAKAALESWTPGWAKLQKEKHDHAAKLFESMGKDPKPDGASKLIENPGTIEPGETRAISVAADGPAMIKALRVQLAEPTAKKLRGMLLRITFDYVDGPSVLTPLGDFFGTGAGDRRFKSLLCGMTDEGYYSYWPMPFTKKALVEIVNDTAEKVKINTFQVGYGSLESRPSNLGYFHARYVQNPDCALGKEYTILDVKGHRGKYVGVNITMQNARGAQGIFFLEGDEKIYCDGEKWPSRWLGTGTEDYYDGAYFWNHPDKAGMIRPLGGPTFLDWGIGRVCAYRWHVTDWISFKDSIRVDQEHGGTNEIPTNYQSVAYYYLDAPTAQPALPAYRDRLRKTSLPPVPENRCCTLKGVPTLAGKALSKRKFHEIDDEIETGDAGQFFAATKSGDTVEAKVEVPGEDEYQVVLFLSGGLEYGRVEVGLDGEKVGTVQAYRAGPRALHPWIELPAGKIRLNGGEHTLELKADAEKQADKQAHIGFVALHLRPTSPLIGVWSTIGAWPCPKDGGWKIVNPPEKEQDLTATYDVSGRGKLSWKKVDAATVHFAGDWSVAYGLTYVWSPDERTVGCFLGRDDSLKVWVNDNVVFDVWGFSHLIPDSGFCTVKLKKGWNKVLVKNGNWGGAFGYCVRFGDPDRELKYARQPD